MWIVFIVAIIVCLVCNDVVKDIRKEEQMTAANMKSAVRYITVTVAVAIFLYVVGEFGMRFYHEMGVDLWSRNMITMNGILYIAMKVCGAVEIFSGLVNLVLIIVMDMKQTLCVGSATGEK